jgi:hypothetical protein
MDSRRASSANISGEPLYYRGIRTEPKYSVGERVRLAHRPSAIGVIRVVDPFASREQYAVQWDDGSGDAAVFADRQAGLSIIRTAIKHSVSRSAVQRIVRRGKAEGRGQ